MARWTSADLPDQSGRTVLVTGANSGLGLRSAEALAHRGATVLMACRSAARAEVARARVAALASGPPPVVVPLDLADLASIRKAAAEVDASVGALDVLMNNAGVMAPPPGRTVDGFEVQFGTNHLGHFALTGLLLRALRRAPAPRVVTTSSLMHRWHAAGWDDLDLDLDVEGEAGGRWPAYGRSKLANLLFMRELARRSAQAGLNLVSVAAHPGYASTHLQPASAAASAGGWLVRRVAGALVAVGNRLVAQPDATGALPQLYAASMPDVASGDYVGPDGPFEMRGAPTRVGLAAAARDDDAARRLWAVSEELTGVTYEW